MGKRLDQLDLEGGPDGRDGLTELRDRADRLVAKVTAMLESGDYDWTWGFLKTLSLDVERLGRCTEAQEQAVQHIIDGHQRHEDQREGWERHERRTGRRYEGWSRDRG